MFGIGIPELVLLFFILVPFGASIWIGLDAKARYKNGLIGVAWFVGCIFFPIETKETVRSIYFQGRTASFYVFCRLFVA